MARAKLGPTALLLIGGGGYVVGKSAEQQMGNNQDSGRGGPGLIRTFFDIVTKSQDSSGSINSLNREVAQLTEQVKALGSIRVANGTPTVVQISGPSQDLVAKSFGGLAVTMAALYSYCYFKGVGYNDIAYVTKSLFKQTVSELKCRVAQVTAAIGTLREQLLDRITRVEKTVERSADRLERKITDDVGKVSKDLEHVNQMQKQLKGMVGNLSDKVSVIEGQTRFSSRGIYLLCNVVSKNVAFTSNDNVELSELKSFANNKSEIDDAPKNVSKSFLCESPSRPPAIKRRNSLNPIDLTPISNHWLQQLCFSSTPVEKSLHTEFGANDSVQFHSPKSRSNDQDTIAPPMTI